MALEDRARFVDATPEAHQHALQAVIAGLDPAILEKHLA